MAPPAPGLVSDFPDSNIQVFSPTPAAVKAVEDLIECFELTYITLLRKASASDSPFGRLTDSNQCQKHLFEYIGKNRCL
jgi:hypothetical protein